MFFDFISILLYFSNGLLNIIELYDYRIVVEAFQGRTTLEILHNNTTHFVSHLWQSKSIT